jgi:hypothetical protein
MRRVAVTAVVHLVWGPLGPEPLRDFLRSYHAHDAGAPHELVVLFNGVPRADREAFLAELRDTPHRLIELDRPVQDLAAYAQVVERLEHDRLCFLNSYSTLLAADWLAKLEHALDQPQVGLVGASGSWASIHSMVLHSLFLPNPYSGLLEKKVARAQFREIELERSAASGSADEPPQDDGPPRDDEPPGPALTRAILAALRTLPSMPGQLLRFEGFPSPHLRTNAFIGARDTLRNLHWGTIERKLDAYLLENGRNRFTRQLRRLGLRTLVVARDGSFYDQDAWPLSHTLWQGDQEGLLIADNQTRLYAVGGMDRRRLLSAYAWGRQAEPAEPSDRDGRIVTARSS